MLMPPIARYMTCQPWTIRRDAKLAQAHELMREHKIRHLPVLEAGKLVGIVSERDVYLFERLADMDTDVTVEDAMTVDVYAVKCEDSVDAVVEKMAEHKYGSVVVMNRRGLVEGIFTTVDGMQVLADVLRRATA
jgi:acetoin utilization protein AcuB